MTAEAPYFSSWPNSVIRDLKDPKQTADIIHLYGDPAFWIAEFRNVDLERRVDSEPADDRAPALDGVARSASRKSEEPLLAPEWRNVGRGP